MGGAVFIRPDRGQAVPEGAMCFHAENPQALADLARFWDLTALDDRYHDFLVRFGAVDGAGSLPEEASLVLRLLLVESYRNAVLRDPRLPAAALPRDWRGHEARALFRRLYQRLAPAAERWVGQNFVGVDGALPAQNPDSAARLESLSKIVV